MTTTPFDPQKVRLELMKELLAVEEQAIKATQEESYVAVLAELGSQIRWLKNKLDFLDSPECQERKQQAEKYPATQFERVPDEHLLGE